MIALDRLGPDRLFLKKRKNNNNNNNKHYVAWGELKSLVQILNGSISIATDEFRREQRATAEAP